MRSSRASCRNSGGCGASCGISEGQARMVVGTNDVAMGTREDVVLGVMEAGWGTGTIDDT